ncbi:lysine exporter LysO family protein [archaeon]|jgi:uncharacterized membrane protein YbjE (DUF340 family)|nr:lysine exporter LysO family protein [archaeon]MBT4647362.1 lysine exporter LysO family protein [archaeon]MBT6821202.1 lysine exporter LysO family protein [archaeon]MBT7391254.1 lysine exporter LysO family protein [archaeon]
MIVFIIGSMILGILLSYFSIIPNIPFLDNLTQIVLMIMLFTVGFDVGGNKKVFIDLKKKGLKIILIPIGIAIGSLLFSVLISFFSELTIWETLAIGSGMGYYSLSSIIITNAMGPMIGAIAFLTNMFREVITIIFTPLFVKLFGKLSAVASGGAPAMDTALGVIKKYTNDEIAFISIMSGVILTILIPFLVTLFSGMS